ncbi:MAG: NAD-binding protein [Polyangiaceae bacterium]
MRIDRNLEHLRRVGEEVMNGEMLYVHGVATEDHTLLEAGVDRARGVIAALTDDRDNLFVTLSARTLNARARIVAKVVEHEAERKMLRAGADSTVSPNTIGGRRMVSEMIRPVVVEFLDQMLRDKNRNLRIEEVNLPATSRFCGLTLRAVPVRPETNALVVAVRDSNRLFIYNPGPDFPLTEGVSLVVLGEPHEVAKLRTMVGGVSGEVEPIPESKELGDA